MWPLKQKGREAQAQLYLKEGWLALQISRAQLLVLECLSFLCQDGGRERIVGVILSQKLGSERENVVETSVGRDRDTANSSVVSNPPESHLALFLLTAPPSSLHHTLTDWRKWMPTNWPDWWGEGASEILPALCSNQLTWGLLSSFSVFSVELATESSLFGPRAH